MPSTTAAIRVVTLPSTMADRAFWKPILMADFTVLPVAISSRIRAKMITLASTAIPMDRMIPAIPGKVRVISKAFRQYQHQYAIYEASAMPAARPGIRYTIIIKINTIANPMTPAIKAGGNCFATQLCTYYVGPQLLQLQGQRTDTDGGCKLISLLVCKVTGDLTSSISNCILDSRSTDHAAIIDNCRSAFRYLQKLPQQISVHLHPSAPVLPHTDDSDNWSVDGTCLRLGHISSFQYHFTICRSGTAENLVFQALPELHWHRSHPGSRY